MTTVAQFDAIEAAGPDLDEARSKVEVMRDSLLELLAAQEDAEVRNLVKRLNGIAVDLRKQERRLVRWR